MAERRWRLIGDHGEIASERRWRLVGGHGEIAHAIAGPELPLPEHIEHGGLDVVPADLAEQAVDAGLRAQDRLDIAVEALEEIDDHAHIGGDMWAIGQIASDALRRIEGENE